MLNVYLKSDPRKLVDALRSKPQRIVDVLKSRLNIVLTQLQRYVIVEKLSGQVLHRRSGALAGAVHVVPAHVVGPTIQGAVSAACSPASVYGRVFEVGGSAAYQIFASKARALHFVSGGKERFAKSVWHPQQMMRPFLRPSLLENETNIREALQQALDEELGRP